jgi:homoserine dehydrogenase
MLGEESPLTKIEGVYNAIQLVGDAVGDVVLSGRGAGDLAAGSAVVSDIIAGARNLLKGSAGRVPAASFQPNERRPLRMRRMEEIRSLYYLRFMVTDRPGVLAQIAGELGRYGISIASMLQKGRREGQTVPIVIKTHTATERDVQTALSHINRLSFMSEPTTLIRIEGKDE